MSNLPPILPTGTQVVSHIDITNQAGDVTFAAGAVGVIVKAPTDAHHAYRVRFMDGTEQSLKRGQFSVHSHHQNPTAPDDHLTGVDLYGHVVYRCVVGSLAYGLDHEESDTLRWFFSTRMPATAASILLQAGLSLTFFICNLRKITIRVDHMI